MCSAVCSGHYINGIRIVGYACRWKTRTSSSLLRLWWRGLMRRWRPMLWASPSTWLQPSGECRYCRATLPCTCSRSLCQNHRPVTENSLAGAATTHPRQTQPQLLSASTISKRLLPAIVPSFPPRWPQSQPSGFCMQSPQPLFPCPRPPPFACLPPSSHSSW